jgi:hypothetical protein
MPFYLVHQTGEWASGRPQADFKNSHLLCTSDLIIEHTFTMFPTQLLAFTLTLIGTPYFFAQAQPPASCNPLKGKSAPLPRP